MLKTLIDELDKIRSTFITIINEGHLAECSLPQDCTSLMNMVNHLDVLVYQTTKDKNSEDDLAMSRCETDHSDEKQKLPTPNSSQEFLCEVKNLLMLKTEPNYTLHVYLSNFLKLLGNLVISICDINNYNMKLASGITVQDLMVIKQLHFTLWELLFSFFRSNLSSQNKDFKSHSIPIDECCSGVNVALPDLVNSLESCLKEMSKVKLDLEHYFKFNFLEMQFTQPDKGAEPKSNVKEYNAERNKGAQYFNSEDCVNDRQSNVQVFCLNVPVNEEQQFNTHNFPPPLAGPPAFTTCTFPQNMEGWDNYQACNFAQDPFGNLFNGPIIYPPDVVFFKPPTVVFKSQVEQARKHSLPKIYSVDSINDDNKSKHSGENFDDSCNEKELKEVIADFRDKEENTINNFKTENTDEDLFSEDFNCIKNEAEYVQLKEKISSLFTLLKSKKISDSEDIFNMENLKMEKEELPSSQKLAEKQLETKNNKRTRGRSKHISRKVTNHIQSENAEKQRLDATKSINENTAFKISLENEKHNGLLEQERLYMDCPMELWESTENEVVYDKQSIIELFKSNPIECLNPESVPTQESAFCLWPVVADYIYVSRGGSRENCISTPSGHSLSLGKSFEKSFYSLQMNKKYEQKRVYDGDLIILNDSACSLRNESTVIYDEYETIENKDMKRLYPLNCAGKSDGRKDQKVSFSDPLVPTQTGGIHAQRTYAVHYADCADSILVGKSYKKEKINFFNFNGYDESHNWDSFISIMASKVGPNTHINEKRMFRKIVKNLGPESPYGNVLRNVHTLTSSDGPFRLFDINGYPLTDSEGNVLHDPYGKCLVELDSTGFPKDNVKVFDAAGNSPKDVRFDPTQKPQANCVIVKLTDNFKRPLHLFDKYGRPLTDSGGNLLVNIHGRPLLRFDNFGRPNTDYRGGPLYTDNGFRWSFKTQSLSKEKISNETLTSQKGNLQKDSTQDSSICSDVTNERPKCDGDLRSPDHTKMEKITRLDERNSDIWLQVETVLQQHSKKTKIEKKPSQTRLLANSLLLNPPIEENQRAQRNEEKQNHDSIIYNYGGECATYCGRDNQKNEEGNKQGNHKVNNDIVDGGFNLLLCGKINCDTKNSILHSSIPTPFYDNIRLNSMNSKKFLQPTVPVNSYIPSIFLENNICKDSQGLAGETFQQKKEMTLCRQTDTTNTLPSIFNYKDHEYLNNLCNQILKNKMESQRKLNDRSQSSDKKDNSTDALLSDFTCSLVSRYTHDIPLYTDSPAVSLESQSKDSQIMKILEDIDSKFRKQVSSNNTAKPCNDLRKDSHISVALENRNKNKSVFKKTNKLKNQRYNEYANESSELSGNSDETNMYVDVAKNRGNQYQINVKERMRTGFQPRGYTNSNCDINDTEYPVRENKPTKHKTAPTQDHQPFQPQNLSADVYHGEYCRHYRNEKNKTKDSPFRFPSEENNRTTIAMNKQANHLDGKQWLELDHNKTSKKYLKGNTDFFINHAAIKHDQIYQKKARDCNLVSFLGTPVKYVLNKLDTKLSLRQDGRKHKHAKTEYGLNAHDKKVKTLYSKGNKKYVASTETNTGSRGERHDKKRGNLLAFKSKSFSEILDSKMGHMSYSGSQDTDKISPESSSQYNKCSSDTAMSRQNRGCPQRKSRRYDVKNPKKEQYSFESQFVHTSNTTNHSHHRRNDRGVKGYNKHTSKSPKNKTRTAKLLKKAGYSGKYKRPR